MITSPKNERIRQLRQLHQAKGRREQSAFLLEGRHLLEEALATCWPLRGVWLTPEWGSGWEELLARIPDSVDRQLVSPEVLAALSTTETPNGVVAVAEHMGHQPEQCSVQLGLLLDTIQDPGNLGSLIRTAAAAGSEGLWLSEGSVDPESPKVLRASAGQWFRCRPQVIADPVEWIRQARSQGVQVLAAAISAAPDSVYWQQDLTRPTLFLLGNEGSGLSAELIAQATAQITIPMSTGVESLNVGIAGALLLYEARRQRWQFAQR